MLSIKNMLVALALVAIPCVAGQIIEAEFTDGAKLYWFCIDRAAGAIKMKFVTPEGKPYIATITCGKDV